MAKKGKLKGKAKAAFLRRMASGRRKAKSVTKSVKKRTKSIVKRRKSQPIKRKSNKRKPSMAKKRRFTRKNKFGIPSIAKKAAAGIGLATIATLIVGNFIPQAAPIVRPVAAFLGGGITGVVADMLVSGGGLLGGLFGGGGSNQMVESV